MENLMEKALRVARANSTVLITGPSGSGKEKVADLIHRWSARAESAMVRVNCGAIPESLFEAEFFGYTAGAFTGARREGKSGLVELAHNSTLFLDEVAEIPLASQVKLLRFLDDGKVFRVGGTTGRQLDVRIIAATNQDLTAMVEKGRFRRDLYYRIRVVPIEIPPLAERREDIAPLLDHFVKYFAKREGCERRISVKAMDILSAYDYPGNVRELINICEQIVVMSVGPEIRPEDLPASTKTAAFTGVMPGLALDHPSANGTATVGLKQMVEEYERLLLQKAIKKYAKRKDAARALGVDPATITRKLQKHFL
jgi:transcriptional regulator with PAS, ATPase and Fis domain